MDIIHKPTGGTVTLTGDADPAHVPAGETFYTTNPNSKQTGSAVVYDAVDETLDAETLEYDIPVGYHDGTGKVSITLEEKSATPGASAQDITPTSGKVLSKVAVAAIPSPYFDVSGVTAAAADVPTTKKFVTAAGALTDGTMPVRGSNNVEVTTLAGTTIPDGSYDGAGKAVLSAAEAAKVVAENIKDGITLLGVTGTLEGVGATAPYVEYTINGSGQVTSAKMYGWNTKLLDYMFYQQTALTSLDLSESPNIISVSPSTFYNCSNLTSVNLPSVTSVGNYAFHQCVKLNSVSLPSATSIGASAYRDCTGITSINLPIVISLDSLAFFGCTNTSLQSITLGSVGHAVTSIGSNAFGNCTQITAITVYTTGGASLANQPWGATGATVTYLSA